MKLSSSLKLGAVAIASVALLAACGSNSSDSGSNKQVLNWAETANLPTMDPSKSVDNVSARTLNNVDEGLLKTGSGNKVRPATAKSYSVSKDGLTWTFNLRKTNWSNGDPVTAQDFVYGWQRTAKPSTASQYAYLLDHVKNFDAVNKGKMTPSKLGIRADGDDKVVVTLSKPQSYFKYIVGMSATYPQNKKVVEKYGSKFAANAQSAVYNGPFKLTGWTGTNNKWTLVKNDQYWDKKNVKLSKINFQVINDQQTWLSQYQSGKVDEIVLDGTQFKNFKNSKELNKRALASTFYLDLNQQKQAIFKNQKARRAISMAINKEDFSKNVLADGATVPKGLVSTGLASRDGKDFADEAYVKAGTEYNLAQAKKLWSQALKATGKSSMTLNLVTDDSPAGKKASDYVQNALSKLPGLKIEANNVPFNVRLSRSTKGQFDVLVDGWIADYPDPISFSSLLTSTNPYNYGHWKNSQYDTLVKNAEGKDANDTGKRWNDLVDAEKILMQDQGIVPLYQKAQPQLLKSKVKGVEYFTTGAQFDFSHAYIK